jgi:hypothetical protein
MSRFKTGRLPAQWPKGVSAFHAYLTNPLPDPPATVDAPKAAYPMDGNDEYGDCTMAGVAHLIAAWNAWLDEKDPVPTLKKVVTEYFAETGGEDTGLVEADVLAKWQKTGLFGHKIKAYAPVKFKRGDYTLIKQALAFYGPLYLGILCPNSAQDQFEQGEPWTYEGEHTEDGHCIVALGYNDQGVWCATWGGVALVTWGFFDHYLEEVWVIVSNALLEKGSDPAGLNVALLETHIAAA